VRIGNRIQKRIQKRILSFLGFKPMPSESDEFRKKVKLISAKIQKITVKKCCKIAIQSSTPTKIAHSQSQTSSTLNSLLQKVILINLKST
jgi:hypothetical protein